MGGRGLFVGVEVEGDGVDAVAGVGGSEAFTLEHVAKVGTAGSTGDFGSNAIGIWGTVDGAFDFGVEAGPATMGIEFGFGLI